MSACLDGTATRSPSTSRDTPRLAHIPVVLLTGRVRADRPGEGGRAGCDGVLAKPFEPQLVISRVKELLARAARRHRRAPSRPSRLNRSPAHRPAGTASTSRARPGVRDADGVAGRPAASRGRRDGARKRSTGRRPRRSNRPDGAGRHAGAGRRRSVASRRTDVAAPGDAFAALLGGRAVVAGGRRQRAGVAAAAPAPRSRRRTGRAKSPRRVLDRCSRTASSAKRWPTSSRTSPSVSCAKRSSASRARSSNWRLGDLVSW